MHTDLSPSIRILLALENGPLSSKELAKQSNIPSLSIYRYLSVLKATGLVRMIRRGIYELTEAGKAELDKRRKEICELLRCCEVK